MLEPDDLDVNELSWLLGLARRHRRKMEGEIARIVQRGYQTREEFFRVRQQKERQIVWARGVEDHLILLVADVDPDELRIPEHRQRLRELERAAA